MVNMSQTKMNSKLRVVFFGTSEFAVPPFRSLIENDLGIVAAVTKPDRPVGRKKLLKPTPVKEYALSIAPSIPIFQPEKRKDEDFLTVLRALNPDLFVVASFPILPKVVLDIPRLGCLNIHPSLLPRYRGAAPIRWTLMNNDQITGVTTFFIGGKVDAGNIFLQRRLDIREDENYTSLHDRLAVLGADLAVESVVRIISGKIETLAQNEAEATPAPKTKPEDSIIDWSKTAKEVLSQIRAFSYDPGASTIFRGKRLKVFSAESVDGGELELGYAKIEKDRILAGCADGCLNLLEVQVEGKKMMDVKTYLRGARLEEQVISMG